MRNVLRITIEVASPPLFGALVLGIAAACIEPRNALSLIGLMILGAYTLAAIPSVVYTLCMEIAFAAGLDPKAKTAVALSALLGLLAGLAMLPWAADSDFIRIKVGALACIPPAGSIVGALVGALVRVIEKKQSESEGGGP